MRLLLQCIALFMAALWLPATQHCVLDTLGLIEAHDTGCAAHGEKNRHAHDTCALVEFSQWLNTAANLDAPQPQASRHTPLPVAVIPALAPVPRLALRIPHPPPPFIPSAFCPGWLPARHFAERAAPSPRAPAPIKA